MIYLSDEKEINELIKTNEWKTPYREYIPYYSFYDNTECFSLVSCGQTFEKNGFMVKRSRDISYATVNYIIEGEITINTGEAEETVFPGETFIIPPHAHYNFYTRPGKYINKYFFTASGPFVLEILKQYGILNQIKFKMDTSDVFENILNIANDKINDRQAINDMSCIEYIKLVQKIAHNYRTNKNLRREAVVIKNYIDNNITENLKLEELAKMVYKSPSQASRIFKEQYGITPYRYITHIRMEKSKEMLAYSNAAVKEIAYLCGFSDEHYFSNFFLKNTGMRPNEFRKNSRGQN